MAGKKIKVLPPELHFKLTCPKCGSEKVVIGVKHEVEDDVLVGTLVVLQCTEEECLFAEGFK